MIVPPILWMGRVDVDREPLGEFCSVPLRERVLNEGRKPLARPRKLKDEGWGVSGWLSIVKLRESVLGR